MSAELDLRDLHRAHEPDPAFVDALELRIDVVLRGAPGDAPAIHEEEGASLDLYPRAPETRTERGRGVGRAVLGAAAALVLLAAIGVIVRNDERNVVEPFTPVPMANGWVAQSFGTIWLMREGESDRAVNHQDAGVCPAFSPDGERLMFGRGSAVRPWAPTPPAAGGGDSALEVATVAANGVTSTLRTIPLDGVGGIPCAIWASDGRWAALGGSGAVWVVDTETAEVRRIPGYAPTDLEWRPGTDELAITGLADGSSTGDNTPIDIYTVSTGDVRTLDDVEAAQLTWSPDGTTIAYTQAVPGAAGTTSGITLIDADGTNQRPLTTDDYVAGHGIGVMWSPRGDQILYQRERVDCTGPACYELSEVVLVTATDTDPGNPMGTERVIPPVVNNLDSSNFGSVFNHPPPFRERDWYATSVTWSPDGTELLYSAGSEGLLTVPVDPARPAIVLSGDSLIGQADDLATSPRIPLQQWQPVP